jgi:acetone carboxylase alpha subunit
MHKTPGFSFFTVVHSDLVFDSAGMCGGYPAPTASYNYTVRNSDVIEKARAGAPLPHTEGDPNAPDIFKCLDGEHKINKGFTYQNMKDGDVFQFFYGSGGGYGDVIERDPVLVKRDLDKEVLSISTAERVFGVVARRNESKDEYEIDLDATKLLREQVRAHRRENAIPVSEWYSKARDRVAERCSVRALTSPKCRRYGVRILTISGRSIRSFLFNDHVVQLRLQKSRCSR